MLHIRSILILLLFYCAIYSSRFLLISYSLLFVCSFLGIVLSAITSSSTNVSGLILFSFLAQDHCNLKKCSPICEIWLQNSIRHSCKMTVSNFFLCNRVIIASFCQTYLLMYIAMLRKNLIFC